MNHYKPVFETVIGTVFTIVVLNPQELLTAFIIGFIGALGALCLTGLKFVIIKLWNKYFGKQ